MVRMGVNAHSLSKVTLSKGTLAAWSKVAQSKASLANSQVIYSPVSWASKPQSQVALSSTEAEYIAMSKAFHDVIPVMGLLPEMREHKFQVICTKPCVYCKVFENNSGALELAWLPKLSMTSHQAHQCVLPSLS